MKTLSVRDLQMLANAATSTLLAVVGIRHVFKWISHPPCVSNGDKHSSDSVVDSKQGSVNNISCHWLSVSIKTNVILVQVQWRRGDVAEPRLVNKTTSYRFRRSEVPGSDVLGNVYRKCGSSAHAHSLCNRSAHRSPIGNMAVPDSFVHSFLLDQLTPAPNKRARSREITVWRRSLMVLCILYFFR